MCLHIFATQQTSTWEVKYLPKKTIISLNDSLRAPFTWIAFGGGTPLPDTAQQGEGRHHGTLFLEYISKTPFL